MAKANIVVSAAARAEGGTLPVPDGIPLQVATVNSGAASQVVATMPSSTSYMTCHVTAIGGPLWLAFGEATASDPEAGEGKGWLLQDGESRSFGVGVGHKLALRDAAL